MSWRNVRLLAITGATSILHASSIYGGGHQHLIGKNILAHRLKTVNHRMPHGWIIRVAPKSTFIDGIVSSLVGRPMLVALTRRCWRHFDISNLISEGKDRKKYRKINGIYRLQKTILHGWALCMTLSIYVTWFDFQRLFKSFLRISVITEIIATLRL